MHKASSLRSIIRLAAGYQMDTSARGAPETNALRRPCEALRKSGVTLEPKSEEPIVHDVPRRREIDEVPVEQHLQRRGR